jgi:hypothetical protein
MRARHQRFSAGEAAILFADDMYVLLKPNALRMYVRNINGPQPASEASERQRLLFWPRLLAAGAPTAWTGSPELRYALRVIPTPSLAPFG